MTDLERLLKPKQLQEIKESLTNRFKQMDPSFMERKQFQYREERASPEGRTWSPRRRGPSRGQQNDPKMNKLIDTLKSML